MAAGEEVVDVVEGHTEELRFTFREDGTVTPYDSSASLAITLRDKYGNLVDHTGLALRIPDSGMASYLPGVGDLTEARAPYALRFSLQDAVTGRKKFYPNGVPILLNVHKP